MVHWTRTRQKKSAGKCNGCQLQWELPLKLKVTTVLLSIKHLPLTEEPLGSTVLWEEDKHPSLKEPQALQHYVKLTSSLN